MKQLTYKQFFMQYPNDDACLKHLMEVRYGLEHKCRKCERDSKFSRVSSQRAYACQFCGDHVYPCVGTPFEASRTSLQTWFYAVYLFTTSRHGVSAKELQRQLGVTYKCAYRMGQEIRKHMAAVDGETPLSGTVEVDETMIGGKQKGKPGRASSQSNKTVILGMIEKDGDVLTKVIHSVRLEHIEPEIAKNIEPGSMIHTDQLRSYCYLSRSDSGYKHESVNHAMGEYVRGDVHTNTIENYWSLLKRGISGTHIHVSKKHMEKYAKEFEYRYNSRKNPEQMISELLTVFPST